MIAIKNINGRGKYIAVQQSETILAEAMDYILDNNIVIKDVESNLVISRLFLKRIYELLYEDEDYRDVYVTKKIYELLCFSQDENDTFIVEIRKGEE